MLWLLALGILILFGLGAVFGFFSILLYWGWRILAAFSIICGILHFVDKEFRNGIWWIIGGIAMFWVTTLF